MASPVARIRRPRLAGIVAGVAIVAVAIAVVAMNPASAPSAPVAGASGTASGAAGLSGAASLSSSPGGNRSAGASGSSASTSPSPAPVAVPLVPIVAPASPDRSTAVRDLVAAVAGRTGRSVIVSAGDLGPLAAILGVAPSPSIRVLPPDAVRSAVAADRAALGVIPAADVTPDVRALAVDGRSLFGAEHVRSLADWPLVASEPTPDSGQAPAAFDPASIWTLVAGGDVMLDRAVYHEAVQLGKGADFPWSGGTASVVASRCCGANGALLPVGRRTGNAGAVRALLSAADVALVNLEGPAPDAFTYHPGGLVFTFDPALLAGLADAGIDVVSLANNHISNAGATGIADTVRHLDAVGLVHAGAGQDLSSARRAATVAVRGHPVAILAYDATRPDLAATGTRAGAAPLRLDLAATDIRAAKATGATVIVMIHWGVEYTDAVTAAQRAAAAALVAAGADAVIGSHPHWVGAIERIDGRPVLYSLGDLVFQLTHDRRTMEGALADLTFVGSRLVQLDLHPTLILDGAQPNLLDPAGGGAQLLADVRRASAALPTR